MDSEELGKNSRLIIPLLEEIVELDDKIEKLRCFIEYWTHEGWLQTFESRERFRKEAKELLK